MTMIRSRTVESDKALFEQYRASHDPAVRNELVLRYRWLSRRCGASMANRGVPLNDLVQVGEIGLIKAVERYDPCRQVAFASFATPTVMGEIRRYFRDMTWSVSVPRRAKELRSRIQTSTDELHQTLGRSPTPEEVGEHCGIDATAVVDTQFANQVYRCSSLERAREVAGVAVERQSATAKSTVDPLEASELRVEAIRAISELPERSQKIILWRFYEDCTQQEIGDRLGVGQVQVSRLLRAAIEQLRRRLAETMSQPGLDEQATSDATTDERDAQEALNTLIADERAESAGAERNQADVDETFARLRSLGREHRRITHEDDEVAAGTVRARRMRGPRQGAR